MRFGGPIGELRKRAGEKGDPFFDIRWPPKRTCFVEVELEMKIRMNGGNAPKQK